MQEVHIIAVGMIPFGKYPDQGVKQLTARVVEDLFAHSGVPQSEIEAVWMGNAGWGMSGGQHCIRGQVALAPLGFDQIPIMNVENACAGGASAFHGAWMGVAAGAYDVALAIGAEKLSVPPSAGVEGKRKGLNSFIAGTDVEVTAQLIEQMKADAERKRRELEAGGKLTQGEGEAPRSPFMDIYSMAARAHAQRHGSTQEQLAIIASKNHLHGSLNPHAQYRMKMSVEEVLNDRLVSHPLTRAMCAPMGDGAAAAIVVSSEYLKRLTDARPVKVRASVLASGGLKPGNHARRAAQKAYAMAGIGPEDIDTAEVHDATAFGELAMCEHLGFCAEGEGGRYAESGATRLGGARPINPSGGLECRGHPIGATGLAQIAEIVQQLRGEAGERQVQGARIGLTENGGGFIGQGEAAIAVHIFEGPPQGSGQGS
jgi:acetyl-CoA acetyltransferase